MATRERTVRSGSAVPAGGRPARKGAAPTRPELHVVEGSRKNTRPEAGGFERLIVWTRSRNTSMLHIVVSVVFLAATLVGALVMRTQMVQNAFEMSTIESHISTLTQDIEDDQTTLDSLISSLPEKAEKMGMEPQQGSLSIDLNGYQSTDTTATNTGKDGQ